VGRARVEAFGREDVRQGRVLDVGDRDLVLPVAHDREAPAPRARHDARQEVRIARADEQVRPQRAGREACRPFAASTARSAAAFVRGYSARKRADCGSSPPARTWSRPSKHTLGELVNTRRATPFSSAAARTLSVPSTFVRRYSAAGPQMPALAATWKTLSLPRTASRSARASARSPWMQRAPSASTAACRARE
jgi:hypothetical protein